MSKAELDKQLEDAPSMDVLKPDSWKSAVDNNPDPYGSRVIQFAEDWSRLMQKEIASGKNLEDVAEATSRLADHDGITGFMYGCAVSILASCWRHGEGLRRWHNLKTQVGTEGEEANNSGGTLNPPLMSFKA